MKKINILKKNEDFSRIIKMKNIKYSKYFIIYMEYETNDIYHFGLSVGKKVGNAVTRNKVKRQLKSIISEKDYQNDFNCIIIVKKEILNLSYEERKNELLFLLNKVKVIKWKREI